ncbi:hypothetical protein E2C01_011986 [Portunus trituberculatus]|uniref:Uncharacterized protein n=1 Tax=Portunus trituberculatus TaxID=210409 RepID=A0A5B7DCM4_PORTR|nr:hypothetical protein [Portunus trituberculatus]
MLTLHFPCLALLLPSSPPPPHLVPRQVPSPPGGFEAPLITLPHPRPSSGPITCRQRYMLNQLMESYVFSRSHYDIKTGSPVMSGSSMMDNFRALLQLIYSSVHGAI